MTASTCRDTLVTVSHLTSAIVRPTWREAQAYINGTPVEIASVHPVHNPTNGTVIGTVQLADVEHADAAVAASVRAFPSWRDLSSEERGRILLNAVDVAERDLGELAATISLEVGKVRDEAFGDIAGGLAMLRNFVELVQREHDGEDHTGESGTGEADRVVVRRVPVGPVAVIGPWNTPVFLTFNGVAPSLASGCTVVVKPPVEAPLALTALLTMIARQLPAGVLNVVPGKGSVIGQRLAEHVDIRAVMFTGSTATGRRVARAASGTVKKVALELGGNDPAIVLASANVTREMIAELIAGSFSMSGQICFNIKRIYVHRSKFDEVVDGMRRGLEHVVVGDPSDRATHIGPLTTADGAANARRLIESARAEGATVEALGRVGAGADVENGQFIRPTIVTGLRADHELVLDEQFAPVMPILPFDDVGEVVAEANRTAFGLASSVWSDDLDLAEGVARQIEAGNTYVNAHRLGVSVPLVPFGGVKQSGLGRTHGLYSLDHCTEEHAIVSFSNPAKQLPGIQRWMPQDQEERS